MHWQAAACTRAAQPGAHSGISLLHFAVVASALARSEEEEPLEVPVHLPIQKVCHLPTNLLYRLLTVLRRSDLGELKKLFVVIETAGLRASVRLIR